MANGGTMELTGLKWLGTRTDRFAEMVSFFRDVMKLEVIETQESFAWFQLPNGDQVEVFGVDDPDHVYFTTGPVTGFGVTNIEAARRELEEAGLEFVGEIQGESGARWSHFYGPDGNLYEITGP
jgi:catechol 2,3-dioxygenase-like lactoylglutathione lyase family enzyme